LPTSTSITLILFPVDVAINLPIVGWNLTCLVAPCGNREERKVRLDKISAEP
jgi:hypothetical protein